MNAKKNAPTVTRTRRHVIIRLTPEEATAAFWMAKMTDAAKLPPKDRSAVPRVRRKLERAADLAKAQPPPRPNRTSIGQRSHQLEYP